MIGDVHFLRPAWLLVLLAAAALLWAVSRRENTRARWRGVIAPHLLDHLLVERSDSLGVRPVHVTAVLMALGAIAMAGPTWQRELPPFVEDQAPLAIAIDLSQTMDAIDIQPTRLERAKLKVRDLLALRPSGRTALFAYAGSAHMVLPLTDDAQLLESYLDALATGIMPVPGKDTAKALAAVDAALANEETLGSILFLTDGVEPRAFDAFERHASRNDILVLGVGTPEGGPVKAGDGDFRRDAAGKRVFTKLDAAALRELGSQTGAQVATVTPDDSDVQWIARRVQTHLDQKQADAGARWRDFGWYLTIPIAALGALWFRRGWTIRWASALALGLSLAAPDPAVAADWRFIDLFLTPDQQGRLAFERGDYGLAAERFTDPMWKGVALYRAGAYAKAADAFARIDTPESDYDQGNALAQLGKLQAAAASYREALGRRPDWPEAKANLALVEALLETQEKDQEEAQEPNQKPDDVQFDDKGKKGKRGEVEFGSQTADMWMRNIQTTPTQLLERRFMLEVQEAKR